MARKSKSIGRSAQASAFANRPVAAPSVRPSSLLAELARSLSPSPLLEFEDRRTWHPDGLNRPARASVRSATRLLPTRSYSSVVSPGVRFAVPGQVLVCVRRQARREVIFAKRLAGRSGGGKRRRNPYSSVSCKR